MKNTVWLFAFSLLVTGCLQESESDLDRTIKRDDALVEDYISSNAIDATKAQTGFYYKKTVSKPENTQFSNGDFIGIYYEIKSLDGQLIDTYMDETKEPLIFKYSQDGLWPIVVAYAAGLSRVGEEMQVFSPSYLAYGSYGYEQLILPSSNLDIKVKFVEKYSEDGLKEREREKILQFINENELEGFEEVEEGIFIRTVEEGDETKTQSKTGSNLTFDFKLFEMGANSPLMDSFASSQPASMSVGNSDLEFLNEGLKGVFPEQELEIIASSFNAYEGSIQIIPNEVRSDLVEKGEQIDRVKPFTPIWFKAEIRTVQ
ncbi:MAG: FKBP-type peptidyl-prolyl cis-trans isomerase [Cyclobacteriaceae bacterium]